MMNAPMISALIIRKVLLFPLFTACCSADVASVYAAYSVISSDQIAQINIPEDI